MVIFADTSGLYALLDQDDRNHARAAGFWRELADSQSILITTNYVVVECFTLVQRRLGLEAVANLQNEIIPTLSILWIDAGLHRLGAELVLAAGRRQLSLVDCTSFVVMRSRSIDHAFAFDRHFAEQDFTVLPQEEEE